MPLARSVAASAPASTSPSMSIVATTGERWAGATHGRAKLVLSAHSYTTAELSAARAAAKANPPDSIIHRSWECMSTRVEIEGVLRGWFCREVASAIDSDSDAGVHRQARPSRRAIAAGETKASHSPPSDPRAFWGEK